MLVSLSARVGPCVLPRSRGHLGRSPPPGHAHAARRSSVWSRLLPLCACSPVERAWDRRSVSERGWLPGRGIKLRGIFRLGRSSHDWGMGMDDQAVGISALEGMPLFAGVTRHDLQNILKIGELRSFEPDQSIVERGEPGDAMYIVL